MNLGLITWAASALSVGKILYDVGEKVVNWAEGNTSDTTDSTDTTTTTTKSQLTKVDGVNYATTGAEKGSAVDYNA